MNCPNCDAPLLEVFAKTKYGQATTLNQCKECGGIWFDEFELYPLDVLEAKKIDKLDIEKFDEKNPAKKSMRCPKCKESLKMFKDPVIPETI